MKTIVIYHKSDYDGIFCREIAKKFIPHAELIGWDYGDATPVIPEDVPTIYMLDISIEPLMKDPRLIWIDHHKSAIEKYPYTISGYRIDGVAACRLAWQWFTSAQSNLPTKDLYVNRTVSEPLAVRLAGEYDIWDHRGDGDLEFQFGLDSMEQDEDFFKWVMSCEEAVEGVIEAGEFSLKCYAKRDADIMRERSFLVNLAGLRFLALNTARCNSNTFASKDKPETGHDALMGFYYNGKVWTFSLYHAAHRKDLDLSKIAVSYGGGGHRGACGFRMMGLPF